MNHLHIYHIVSLFFAIAIGYACSAQQIDERIEFGEYETVLDSEGYISLHLEGCNSWNRNVGYPELPLLQWIVETEPNATATAVAIDSIIVNLDKSASLRPSQPSQLKGEEKSLWQINYETYEKEGFYSLPLIEIAPLGIMGNTQLSRVSISPVKYNPRDNKLIIYTHIRYLIKGVAPQKATTTDKDIYVAVTPSKYIQTLQPLLQWRQQMGLDVRLLEVTHNDKDSIRTELRRMYRNGETPTYIILVGGLNDIEAFMAHRSVEGIENELTDLYYGEYTNDWFPDAMLGRLPVNDTTELHIVIDKILNYEQHPDSTITKRALIVAGKEKREPAPTTTNGQVNYISTRLSNWVDTICFRNPQSETLKDSITATLRSGVGLINYTAHCEENQWKSPTITSDEFDTLANVPSIWINNCCLSNLLGRNGLGEGLIKQSHGGGVGVIGSTNQTFWEEDYYWSIGAKRPIELHPSYDSTRKGALDQLINHKNLGEILLSGNMAVTAIGSPYEAYYWEIYNLFGDPTTRPYIGITPQLDSTHIEGLTVGQTHLTVHGDSNVCITLLQNGEIIGKCRLNSQSDGNMQLTQPINTTDVIVTTSKDGYRPQIDTITPLLPNKEWLYVRIVSEIDSIALGEQIPIKIEYKNIGHDTIHNHQIELHQTTQDSMGAWLSQPCSFQIRQLAPNTVDTLTTTIAIARLNGISHLSTHITTKKNNETYNSYQVIWPIQRSEINSTLSIHQQEEISSVILPHQQYSIKWTLSNTTPYPIETCRATIKIECYPQKTITKKDWQFDMDAMEDSLLTMVLTTDDTLQGILITTQLDYDGIKKNKRQWMIAGHTIEDFESGELNQFKWQNESLIKWSIDSTISYTGNYSLKSGKIDHHQQCKLNLWVNVTTIDTIGFWCKTSSERDKDVLYFYIDDVEWYFASGMKDWKYWSKRIYPGIHKLTWKYQKNKSNSHGEDAVWIDNIRLPISQWDEICGTMDSLIYIEPMEIQPNENSIVWDLWPNPAHNIINLECNQPGKIEILDCMGDKIDEFKIENIGITQYSLTHLRFGLYILIYTTEYGSNIKKLMITP